jgi:hypothetical protein
MEWLNGEWLIGSIQAAGQEALPLQFKKSAKITIKDGKADVSGLPLLGFDDFSFRIDPTVTHKHIDVTFLAGALSACARTQSWPV